MLNEIEQEKSSESFWRRFWFAVSNTVVSGLIVGTLTFAISNHVINNKLKMDLARESVSEYTDAYMAYRTQARRLLALKEFKMGDAQMWKLIDSLSVEGDLCVRLEIAKRKVVRNLENAGIDIDPTIFDRILLNRESESHSVQHNDILPSGYTLHEEKPIPDVLLAKFGMTPGTAIDWDRNGTIDGIREIRLSGGFRDIVTSYQFWETYNNRSTDFVMFHNLLRDHWDIDIETLNSYIR